ncbi:hypothetical protein GQ457_02G038230 [Hibiscus cannabinus]
MATGRWNLKSQSSQVVTLFVENLSESLHWQGLWYAFGRHGDVVDAFIARKTSRGRKRFGFVRYARMSGAERVVERLNGFALYGKKLFVTFAKFKTRQAFWRKVQPEPTRNSKLEKHVSRNRFEETDKTENKQVWCNMESRTKSMEEGEPSASNEIKHKRIAGHVENEDLWIFKRCLVGKMASICSVSSIMEKLDGWGFGEIRVQRMGEKHFYSALKMKIST